MAVLGQVGDARVHRLRRARELDRLAGRPGPRRRRAGRSRTGPGRPRSARRRRGRPCRRSRRRAPRTRCRSNSPARDSPSTSSSTSPTVGLDLREQRHRPARPCGGSGRRSSARCVGGRDDVAAVAQHGRGVAQVEHLAQAMADEQDATPRSRRPRTIVNRRSTSWADSDAVGSSRIRTPRVDRQRLGDLDQLLVGHRQAADRRLDVEPDVELLEQRLRLRGASRPSRRCRSGPDGAWPMNTFSATVRSGNSRGSWWTTAIPSARAWAGPAMTVRLAVDADRARVRLVDAGQDLDQRALAGAVLADQRVDLAGAQVERHVRAAPGWRRTTSTTPASEARTAGRRHGLARSPVIAGGPARPTGSASPRCPRARRSPDHVRRRRVVGQDRVDVVGPAERRERDALPLGVVDDRDDRAGRRPPSSA